MATSRAVLARAQLGVAARRHADDPKRITDARRNLAAAKLEDYIRRTVEAAPPLSDDQKRRLASLLHAPATPAAGGSDAA